MIKKEELIGGREGKIFRYGDCIIRPSNYWTKNVHDFLKYLNDKNFICVPTPYGINNSGEEILSFVPGEIFNYPLPEILKTDTMIISVGKLLKKIP